MILYCTEATEAKLVFTFLCMPLITITKKLTVSCDAEVSSATYLPWKIVGFG